MSRDELAVMDGNKCILQLRGVRPFYSDKFDITKHKRISSYPIMTQKNEFHVEEIHETPDEVCCVVLWVIPHSHRIFKVMKAWGFEYKTVGFVCLKPKRTGEGYVLGIRFLLN